MKQPSATPENIVCRHCRTEIPTNTHKKFITCTCGKIAVDGCEDYVRLIGDSADFDPSLTTYKQE